MPTVSAEARVEVVYGGACGSLRCAACSNAVDCPLAEDKLHDGLSPTCKRDGGEIIVGVATAADE